MYVTELLLFSVIGLVLVYPYLIYPVALHFLTWKGGAPSTDVEPKVSLEQYKVSVLLAVHNEKCVIAEKIQNFLDQDYPEDKTEMIVVSDGSTDGTEEIIKSLGHVRVTLLVQKRAGKTAALNAAAEMATGEVLIFTDANTMFLPNAIRELVAHFDDPQVGLVSGQAVSNGTATSEGIYQRFERYLKTREGWLGMVAGADGAIYALRSERWKPLKRTVINDFFHPIDVALAGVRSGFGCEARAMEKPTEDVTKEFARQKRMAAQAFGILCWNLGPLLRSGKFLTLWILVSHRLIRWAHAPAMAACLLMLIYFGWTREAPWLYLLVGGYVGALVLGRLRFRNWVGKIFRLFYDFELIHLAYFCGVLDLLRGRTYETWNPRGGTPNNA